MRNLKLIYKIKWHIKNIANVKQAFTDPNCPKSSLYLRTDTDILLYDCENESAKTILTNSVKIIDWEYLALNNEICIARDDGEVMVVNLTNRNVESVTFCEGGIERMCWSPDQEAVVFITADKNVVVMNCTYDPIAESPLHDDAFGDQEFITVGWGKKETQFHGSEGKAAAKKKSDFVQPEDLSIFDPTVSVVWRGDGEYFSVSFLSSYGRTFKIYNKEGQLQYTAEKLNNLGEAITWRPSGNWIAVPHKFPNKYTIGLFEKNGLRHREIVLPFKEEEEPVVGLCWNSDSDILAVETLKDQKSNIYLYTIGNYHWYLKQTLNFNEKISMMRWDTEFSETKTLHVIFENGTFLKYRWAFEICTSIGNTVSNLSIVGVIDGKQLLLTDFRNNCIPPPMSKCALEANGNINWAGFINNPENPQKLFVVTSEGKLATYSMETHQPNNHLCERLKGANLLKEYSVLDGTLSELPLNYSHWIWLNDDQFIFCDSNAKESTIFLYNLSTEEKASKSVSGQIVAISPVSRTSFLIELVTGCVLRVDVQDDIPMEPELFINLPEYCENFQAVTLKEHTSILALDNNQNLYLNDTKAAAGVTSFFIGERYFAYTQLASIKFIHLEKLHQLTVASERRIERGGKLIVIVPKDATTVLQMPRGNLEAIQPRVLALQIIIELLDASEYEKAMLTLRKQRINLNLIFDHNPKKFIVETDAFLTQISNPHWLNLFLTELENEDYTQTKYSSNYVSGQREYPENFQIENKIPFVCDHICDALKSKNEGKFTDPIITCYVKKGELENALQLIWNLYEKDQMEKADKDIEKEDKDEDDDIEMKEETPKRSKYDEALRYLLYMTDVNELYNVALGMYNFHLVVLVASKSQKDPKEYLRFLQDLQNLEENYRKFKVDDHLKRYAKAFQNIANCGKERFEECLEYVEKHNLYTVALERFNADDVECYKRISLLFADYLRIAGKLEEASVMYERGGDLKQAITSAKHVLDIDRCLMMAKEAGYERNEMKELALSLVPGLQANSRHEDAFNLLSIYSDNFDEAVKVLLEGRHYLRAIFVTRTKANNICDEMVKPHLKSYVAILQSTIEADKEKYLRHTNRLKVLRMEKANKGLDENYVDEGDLISETTSVTSSRYTGSSRSTGKTFRSSKNRRKHERKLLNLKEGSKFEDIALIDALYKLVLHIFDQQQHMQKICKALIEVRFDCEGRSIQSSYRNLLDTVKNRLDEIWIPEMMSAQQTMFGPNIDYAQIQSEQHYAMIPPQQRFKPHLNIIEWEHLILK